ncbi:MAG: tetratricopeptide repeat protein [Bacteroidota bacterium]
MTTKKIILGIAFLAFCFTGIAQKNNLTSAIMTFNDAQKAMQGKNKEGAKKYVIQAKEYIDKAAAHEETMKSAKMFFYKGQIYMVVGAFSAAKEPEFTQFDAEKTLDEAMNCFRQSIANKNKKEDFSDQITMTMNQGRFIAFNQGIDYYNKKKYDSAMITFEGCVELMDVVGQFDTLSAFNAGLCAEKIKNYDKAIKYFSKCADVKYNGASMYVTLVNTMFDAGKEDAAYEYIKKGRTEYPKDKDIIVTELSYHLRKNNNEEAEKALNLAISNDPKNQILYFSAGVVYDNLKRYADAEKAYLKAIELDAKYFDAYFNLGAMYHNEAADIYNKITDIKDNALYNQEKGKADELFKKAQPVLEKAREINPKDRDNLIMLRNVYGRLNLTDKWQEVNTQLKNN